MLKYFTGTMLHMLVHSGCCITEYSCIPLDRTAKSMTGLTGILSGELVVHGYNSNEIVFSSWKDWTYLSVSLTFSKSNNSRFVDSNGLYLWIHLWSWATSTCLVSGTSPNSSACYPSLDLFGFIYCQDDHSLLLPIRKSRKCWASRLGSHHLAFSLRTACTLSETLPLFLF
jgi:hypothetical protein